MISENQFLDVVLFIAVLAPSVILHEVAHGWVAERLGDPTARRLGRITLNPVRHVDPVGSLLMPAMLALAGQPVWGWARPVPVSPGYFRRPTQGMAVVGLAGPATNLTLAVLAARLGPLVDMTAGRSLQGVALLYSNGIGLTTAALWGRLVFAFAVVNLALAIFNLLPLPPLDGSRLVPLVLPAHARMAYERLSQYGFLILFVLVFVFRGSLSFLGTVIDKALHLIV